MRWIGAAWVFWLAWGAGVGGAGRAASAGPAGRIGLELSGFELKGFEVSGLRFRGLQLGKRRRFRCPKQVALQGQLALLLGWRGHGVRGAGGVGADRKGGSGGRIQLTMARWMD